MWEAIEAVISRAELRAAVATVNEMVPPGTDAGADDWRAGLAGRFTTVSGFVKLLTGVIEFGANAEGRRCWRRCARCRRSWPTAPGSCRRRWCPGALIEPQRGAGPVAAAGVRPPRAARTGRRTATPTRFCVLEQFWRHLKRREIYADASTRWRNPQARLLAGEAWERSGTTC